VARTNDGWGSGTNTYVHILAGELEYIPIIGRGDI